MFIIETLQDAKQVRPAREISHKYSDKLLINSDKDAISVPLASDGANHAALKAILALSQK